MKYSWSDYCQNAQQLAASRIISLTDSTKEILCRHLPELKGAKILDVGCGTGIFTFFLDDCFQSCEICGLDYDASFVETANHNIPDQMHNQYHFVQGDGYSLPFQDEAFDLVISHTYLTSIPDPERALSEKIRVAKKGGLVVSVTAQSFQSQMCSPGNYKQADLEQMEHYLLLKNKCEAAYAQQFPPDQYFNVKAAAGIPQLFGKSGLRDITIQPIGFAFSLSDCKIPMAQKRKFIRFYFDGEKQKLQKFAEMPEFRALVSEAEISEYMRLMERQRVFQMESLGENTVWEWISGLNIMMMGTKSRY